MNIGDKLHQARIKASLTQEQTAEALGISRQTVSNWENQKTYPDIRSVVMLSDLYNVSLDYLLKAKEEPAVSDYLNYLEESTDTVKSKTKLSKFILIITYLLIWSSSIMLFWYFTNTSDSMKYSLAFLWTLLPVTTLVITVIIGRNNYWGKRKWLSCIAFGLMYMRAEYATFSAANMLSVGKLTNPREWIMLFIGVLISVTGIGIGAFIRRKKQKNKSS